MVCRSQMLRVLFTIALPLLWWAHSLAANPRQPLGEACFANASEACYFVIDGEITEDLVSDVINRLETQEIDAFKVLLNSEGGDLSEGLRLGRAIRANDLETTIGIYRQMDTPLPGECVSACAYAFLGGTERFVGDGNRLGFHRFAIAGETQMAGSSGLVIGQMLSANVVSYIVEMGVDARLFTRAAETQFESMYFPDAEARRQFDVETQTGFDHFFMEPYRNGVVVASKRIGPTHAYDRVDQLTAYCQNGQARILLTMRGENQFAPSTDGASIRVDVALTSQPALNDWIGVSDGSAMARSWKNDSGAFIEIAFDPAAVPVTDKTEVFRASFFRSRADGGDYRAVVQLNDMDRQMLRAAFRMCI